MAAYLIKVTLIWALLLILYEALYRKSRAFTLNRLYLLLALLAGALLPLVPISLGGGTASGGGRILLVLEERVQKAGSTLATMQEHQPGHNPFRYELLLAGLYSAGALVMLALSLKEVVLILRKAVYGNYEIVAGHRLFNTGRIHAPFSFMGWIFIGNARQYEARELNFILVHEDAHNRRKHWLDMIILQLFTTLFWFHPLVWRIRHLLRLEHEYEADALAAGDDAYHYGHFLLQQALLKGTPSIAHSFHYAPIKNRIAMLTNPKPGNARWKYLAVIPAVLCCTLLMARSAASNDRIKTGNKVTFKGNDFYWSSPVVDSIEVMDPIAGKTLIVANEQPPAIVKMNKDSVYNDEMLNKSISGVGPQFRYQQQSIHDYLKQRFGELVKQIPDSLSRIQVDNIVLDEKGRVVYYDITATYVRAKDKSKPDDLYFSSAEQNSPRHLEVMDKILSESPAWMPGIINGKAVPVFLSTGALIEFKPLKFRVSFGAAPAKDKK